MNLDSKPNPLYMMAKQCKFCLGKAHYICVSEIEMNDMYTYICELCNAEYLYWIVQNSLVSWGLFTEVGDKLYKWKMAPSYNKFGFGTIFYIPGIVPSKSGFRQYLPVVRELQHIKSFTNIEQMTITPSNINEKIRTYLLFL